MTGPVGNSKVCLHIHSTRAILSGKLGNELICSPGDDTLLGRISKARNCSEYEHVEKRNALFTFYN